MEDKILDFGFRILDFKLIFGGFNSLKFKLIFGGGNVQRNQISFFKFEIFPKPTPPILFSLGDKLSSTCLA